MPERRTYEFPIITNLGGTVAVLELLEAIGAGITRRAMTHWYLRNRRRIAGPSTLALQTIAEALDVKYQVQDFVLDSIDWGRMRVDLNKVVRRDDAAAGQTTSRHCNTPGGRGK